MGAAACCSSTKTKSELGVNARSKSISRNQLSQKIEHANKIKMLSFDNTQVTTLSKDYCIEKLRVMHFVNCGMANISGPESVKVFQAAGVSLKKVNLSHNKIESVPHGFFQICPQIESLILSNNQISVIPWTLSLLTKLTEIDLSCNRFNDEAVEQYFPSSLKVVNLAKN